MRRTTSNADASAVAAAINTALGYPRDHTESEVLRLGGGIHVPTIRTTSAVAVVTTGGTSDVMVADAHVARVADATLRARFEGSPRPEGDRVPASTVGPIRNGIERMLPVILLANTPHLPATLEVAPGEVQTLWDSTYATSYGQRYVRSDGQREFVVQIVATLGAQYVTILWSAGSDSDAGEAAYIAQMLAVGVAGGLVAQHWPCTRVDGLWMPQGLSAEVLAAWPAEWHSAGSPCVGPAQ